MKIKKLINNLSLKAHRALIRASLTTRSSGRHYACLKAFGFPHAHAAAQLGRYAIKKDLFIK
jgi:hypothetical protein